MSTAETSSLDSAQRSETNAATALIELVKAQLSYEGGY